jgi:hypothetical protein
VLATIHHSGLLSLNEEDCGGPELGSIWEAQVAVLWTVRWLISGEILDKREKLTVGEMSTMKAHVRMGVRILEPVAGFREALPSSPSITNGLMAAPIPRVWPEKTLICTRAFLR